MNKATNGQKTLMTTALTAMATALVTFGVVWFTIVGDRVDRAEVLDLIQTTAPYVLDRGVLISGMEANTKAIDRLNDELLLMKLEQVSLGIKMDMLIAMMDARAVTQ